MRHARMFRQKRAPDLIRGARRFADENMCERQNRVRVPFSLEAEHA
jgi:hypothetical protein